MFVQHLLRNRVVPFPFEVDCLTLLFSHQTDIVILITHHDPFFDLSTIHDGINWVIIFPSFQFGLCWVQVKRVLELDACLPTMLGWEAASYYMISISIAVRFFRILSKKIVKVDVFTLMQLQKLNYLIWFWLEALELHLLWSQHELTAKTPSRTLTGSVDKFMRTWIFTLVIIFQLLRYFCSNRILNCLIITQRFELLLKFLLDWISINLLIYYLVRLFDSLHFMLLLSRWPWYSSDIPGKSKQNLVETR